MPSRSRDTDSFVLGGGGGTSWYMHMVELKIDITILNSSSDMCIQIFKMIGKWSESVFFKTKWEMF